jgi:TolB protein
MRVALAVLTLWGVLAGSVRPAGAVVTGAIFGPGSQAFPIAVVALKNLGGDPTGTLGARFAQVLSRDLEFSGYFRLLDPRTFIENPQTSGITAAEVDFVGWAALGAQAVVKGGISGAGDTITVEVRLFDVPGRQDVAQVGKRFTGPRTELPRMAHKTADAILEFLTGERGPFDSAIALVSTRAGRLKDVYRWTFDLDEPARLTDERSIVVNPRWRPDGRAVLFTSYREHLPRLFQVELPGRQVTRVVGGPGAVLDGAWAPDGSRLLVTREQGGNSDIWLVDRGGRGLRQLTGLGARRHAPDLRRQPRWLGHRARVTHGQLQYLSRVVAEGRPSRLDDAGGRRIPDRHGRGGRLQRADDHGAGQQRESVVGPRWPLSRLLVDARRPASSGPRRSRRQDAKAIDPRGRR